MLLIKKPNPIDLKTSRNLILFNKIIFSHLSSIKNIKVAIHKIHKERVQEGIMIDNKLLWAICCINTNHSAHPKTYWLERTIWFLVAKEFLGEFNRIISNQTLIIWKTECFQITTEVYQVSNNKISKNIRVFHF